MRAIVAPVAAASSISLARGDGRLLGPLEEDVGDLDLRRAQRLGDGERVDRALGLVAAASSAAGRSRRGGRSCSRRPAAARPRARPAGRSSRAGRCRRRRAGSAPRPGIRVAPAPIRSRRSGEPSQPRTGSSSASASAGAGSSPAATAWRAPAPREGSLPAVRLAPLEQRVDGGALRAALLARRRRRRLVARVRTAERERRLTQAETRSM